MKNAFLTVAFLGAALTSTFADQVEKSTTNVIQKDGTFYSIFDTINQGKLYYQGQWFENNYPTTFEGLQDLLQTQAPEIEPGLIAAALEHIKSGGENSQLLALDLINNVNNTTYTDAKNILQALIDRTKETGGPLNSPMLMYSVIGTVPMMGGAQANLYQDVNLKGAYLGGTHQGGALVIDGFNLQGKDLTGVTVSVADLARVGNLNGTNLTGTGITRAQLTGRLLYIGKNILTPEYDLDTITFDPVP